MQKNISRDEPSPRTKASYRTLTGSQSPKRSKIPTPHSANKINDLSYNQTSSPPSLSIAFTSPLEYGTIDEDDDNPINEDLIKRIAEMRNYLKETGLKESFDQLCHSLLNREDLPFNPYPGFVRRLRPYIEKFHMFRIKSNSDVLKMVKCQSQQSNIPHIYSIYNCDYIWGLANIINYVNAAALAPYKNFTLQHLVPSSSSLILEEDYSCQILVALVGPVVFVGTFYLEPVLVNVRLEYLWYGLNVKKGAELFAKSVKNDLQKYISNEDSVEESDENISCAILLGFYIPNVQSYKSQLSSAMLTKQDLQTYWEELDLFIIESIKKQLPITTQLLILLDKSRNLYKKCNKEYYFHFTQISQNQNDNQLEKVYISGNTSFITLHEGFFLKKAHAEAYISIFNQKFEIDKKKGKHTSEEYILPYSQQIINSLKETWQYQIVHLDKEAISQIAYRCLLLFLIDGNKTLLVEVYRLLQSKYMKLFVCTSTNKQLQDLIKLVPQKINCILLYFQQYKRKLLNILDTKLQECSSHFQSAHDFLQVILELPLSTSHTNDFLPNILEEIIGINHYCSTLLIQLAEDALANCSSLNNFLDSLYLRLYDGEKDDSLKNTSDEEVIFPHGAGYELAKHDFQFINLEKCMKVSKRPSIMTEEGVLMQYMIDTKIDMVWQDFLIDILSDVNLLPNPYPRLVSYFRQASLKMELCHTSKIKQSDLLFHHSEKLVDSPTSIYHVPGCDAYGQISAISVLDNTYFQKVAFVAKNLLNTSYAQRIGQLKVCMALAITGYSPLYGKFCPYLSFLKLHEHCYIKSPLGFEDEAIFAYAKIVLQHLLILKSQQNVLLVGLYVEKNLLISSKDIKKNLNDENFKERFKNILTNRQTLWIKLYYVVGWRYLEVKKILLLHFVDNAEDRYESFFLPDPIFLYQEVFIFLDQAVLNFIQRNAEDKANSLFSPNNLKFISSYLDDHIRKSAATQNFFHVYQLVLTKSLINKSSFYLAEVFQMFHSPAYVLLYLSHLNKALQDLILMEFVETNENKSESTANNSKNKQSEDFSKNQVDNLTLGHMATAYHQQVNNVLNYSGSLTPASLLKRINNKLSKIFKPDTTTKDKFIIINHLTISILCEVDKMLEAVQHSLIMDMMHICIELPQLLTSVETQKNSEIEVPTFHSKLFNPLQEL